MAGQVEEFSFSDKLDIDFLKEVYEDDMEYALDIFEIFLDTFEEEYGKLKAKIESSNCSDIRAAAHKMKPTFSMVGLTKITKKFKKLEAAAKNDDCDSALEIFKEVDKTLLKKIPLIKSQKEQLSAFVNNSN